MLYQKIYVKLGISECWRAWHLKLMFMKGFLISYATEMSSIHLNLGNVLIPTLVNQSVYAFIFCYNSIKNCTHFMVKGILILQFGVPIGRKSETQQLISQFTVWRFPMYYETAAVGTWCWVGNFYFSRSLSIYKQICYTPFCLTTFSGCLYMQRQGDVSL
jgi:hypothetical protein